MKYRAPRALQHPPRHRRVPGLEAMANGAALLFERRARIALGTATQYAHINDSPPPPSARARSDGQSWPPRPRPAAAAARPSAAPTSLMLRIDSVTAISPSAAHSIFGSARETWLHTEAVCTPPPPAAALAAATAAALGRPPPSPPARPIPKIDYQSHPELGARRVPTHTEAPWLVNGGHGASLRHHKVGRARSPPPSAGAPTSC
jgi:hypothetical protein